MYSSAPVLMTPRRFPDQYQKAAAQVVPEASTTASFTNVLNTKTGTTTSSAQSISATSAISGTGIARSLVSGYKAGKAISGDKEVDGNSETQNFDNEKIWTNGSMQLPVRLLANDEKTDGMGKDYFIDDIVSKAGAFEMQKNADGTVTATGRDFVSSESGLYYKFMGFTPMYSKNPLIAGNTYTLGQGEQKDVFRGYWNTFKTDKSTTAAGTGGIGLNGLNPFSASAL